MGEERHCETCITSRSDPAGEEEPGEEEQIGECKWKILKKEFGTSKVKPTLNDMCVEFQDEVQQEKMKAIQHMRLLELPSKSTLKQLNTLGNNQNREVHYLKMVEMNFRTTCEFNQKYLQTKLKTNITAQNLLDAETKRLNAMADNHAGVKLIAARKQYADSVDERNSKSESDTTAKETEINAGIRQAKNYFQQQYDSEKEEYTQLANEIISKEDEKEKIKDEEEFRSFERGLNVAKDTFSKILSLYRSVFTGLAPAHGQLEFSPEFIRIASTCTLSLDAIDDELLLLGATRKIEDVISRVTSIKGKFMEHGFGKLLDCVSNQEVEVTPNFEMMEDMFEDTEDISRDNADPEKAAAAAAAQEEAAAAAAAQEAAAAAQAVVESEVSTFSRKLDEEIKKLHGLEKQGEELLEKMNAADLYIKELKSK